jgi:hypothetical protein
MEKPALLRLLTSAFGTKLTTAYATACPQLAKADVRALTGFG